MFPSRYFSPRYFTIKYWPPVLQIVKRIVAIAAFFRKDVKKDSKSSETDYRYNP